MPQLQIGRDLPEQRERLIAAAVLVPLFSFYDYKEYLKSLYNTLNSQEHSISHLDLAEQLGFSRTNVIWMVMTGRRKLTSKSAEKIATALKFSPDERSYLKLLVIYNNTMLADQREYAFQRLMEITAKKVRNDGSDRMIEYFQEWYHPIVRELTGTENFSSDPAWIASKLTVKVSPLRIKKSLALLESIGLIKYDVAKNRHVRTDQQVVPKREFRAMTMIRYHQKACEAARDAIAGVRANEREFNVLTVSLSDEGFSRVVDLLRAACAQILEIEREYPQAKQVFQANIQLFPVTKAT